MNLEVWFVNIEAVKIIFLFGFFIANAKKYFATFSTVKQEQFANMPVNVVYRSNFFNVVDLKVFKAEKVRKFYHLKKSNILFSLPPPT